MLSYFGVGVAERKDPRRGPLMETSFAFLCDAASQAGGKISALGLGWDTLYAASVPHTQQSFNVVANFRFHSAEAGDKNVRIRLMDADGGDVIPPLGGGLPVRPPESGTTQGVNFVMALNGLVFKTYGDYSLHILLDGDEKVRLPFRVAPPPAKAQPG